MSIFEEFAGLCADFDVCKGALLVSHERAKDVLGAITGRLEAERRQTAERIRALEKQAHDPGRSETMRRIAALELERLQGRAYAVTEDERTAFTEAIHDAETAAQDMRRLKVEIRQAISDLDATVKQLREDTLGFDVDLSSTWTEGIQKKFDRLGHTAQ